MAAHILRPPSLRDALRVTRVDRRPANVSSVATTSNSSDAVMAAADGWPEGSPTDFKRLNRA